MNKKKLGKVTGVAAASFLIAGTTAFTAFAAMPSGTAVIGDKAYDLNYVNDPANEAEIVAAMQKANFKVYVKDFAGNWIVNETETALTDLSVIPAVEYKNAKGEVTKYLPKDGDIDTTGGGVVTGDLKVVSVSAINPKEIQVKFNKPVLESTAINATNYEFVLNNSIVSSPFTGTATKEGSLSEDKMSVTFQLVAPLQNGFRYSVNVKSGVLDTNYNQLAKYADIARTFSDVDAPQVVKAKVIAGTTPATQNKVKLYFNEPINASSMIVKVDGVEVSNISTLIGSAATALEDYTFTTPDINKTTYPELFTAGTHTVVIYNAKDLVPTNPNTASVLSTTYTVTADTTAPTVQSVTPVNSRVFDIKFSEVLSVDPTITVKKGNFTYPVAKTDGSSKINYVKLSTDATGCTYRVSIDEDSLLEANPLYATGEANVGLTVNIKGYKDAVSLLGSEVNQSVTLTKDATTPTVLSVNANTVNSGKLNVKFDKQLDAAIDATKIVVADKDGIVISGVSATLNATDKSVVEISLGTPAYAQTSEPYTVTFQKGAVKYQKIDKVTYAGLGLSLNDAFEKFNLNTNVNELLTTTVGSTGSVAPVVEKLATIIDASVPNTGILFINYAIDMGDSAVLPSNYLLDGVALPAGTTVNFFEGKQKVRIVFPAGTFTKTQSAKLTIKTDVRTKAGSQVVLNALTKSPVENVVSFTDNTKPVLTEAKYLVNNLADTKSNKIQLKFNENLATVSDTPAYKDDLKVYVNGALASISQIAKDPSDAKIINITLSTDYNVNQAASISTVAVGALNVTMDIADTSANKLTEGTTVTANTVTLDLNGLSNKAVADTVIAKIAALPAVGSIALTDKAAVVAARTAYTNLTAEQQTYVTNFATLTAAEAKIADLEAADAVVAKITALPAVGSIALTDKAAVVAARTAYTNLTVAQQAYVTNLATLTAAEAKIADLEAVSAAKTALTTLDFDTTDNATSAIPKIVAPADVNGVVFTFTAKGATGTNSGDLTIAGDAKSATVTRSTTTADTITLTVTFTKGSVTDTKEFTVTTSVGTDAVTIS